MEKYLRYGEFEEVEQTIKESFFNLKEVLNNLKQDIKTRLNKKFDIASLDCTLNNGEENLIIKMSSIQGDVTARLVFNNQDLKNYISIVEVKSIATENLKFFIDILELSLNSKHKGTIYNEKNPVSTSTCN